MLDVFGRFTVPVGTPKATPTKAPESGPYMLTELELPVKAPLIATPIVLVDGRFTVEVTPVSGPLMAAPNVEVVAKDVGIVEVVWPASPIVPVVPMLTVEVVPVKAPEMAAPKVEVDGKLTVDVTPVKAPVIETPMLEVVGIVTAAPRVDVDGKFTVLVLPGSAVIEAPNVEVAENDTGTVPVVEREPAIWTVPEVLENVMEPIEFTRFTSTVPPVMAIGFIVEPVLLKIETSPMSIPDCDSVVVPLLPCTIPIHFTLKANPVRLFQSRKARLFQLR